MATYEAYHFSILGHRCLAPRQPKWKGKRPGNGFQPHRSQLSSTVFFFAKSIALLVTQTKNESAIYNKYHSNRGEANHQVEAAPLLHRPGQGGQGLPGVTKFLSQNLN